MEIVDQHMSAQKRPTLKEIQKMALAELRRLLTDEDLNRMESNKELHRKTDDNELPFEPFPDEETEDLIDRASDPVRWTRAQIIAIVRSDPSILDGYPDGAHYCDTLWDALSYTIQNEIKVYLREQLLIKLADVQALRAEMGL